MTKNETKAAHSAGTRGRPTKPMWTRFEFTGARLYVATPKVMFETPMYFAHVRSSIRRVFPDVELVFGASSFHSNADWLERWPEVLGSIDGLVFASDPDGWIGAGVYKEVEDAVAAGIPVGCFHGLLVTLDAVEITVVNPDDRVRYAQVTLKRA